MQVQGHWIYIDSPNGQIKFHQDLKKYFEILNYFNVQRLECEQALSDVEKSLMVKSTVDKIISSIIGITKNYILPELSQHGVYNLTTDDFIAANPGVQQILAANNALAEYRSSKEATYSTWSDAEKEKAAARASANITGPGYGIITNDFLSFAAYKAHSNAVLNRQAHAAKWQYDKEAYSIHRAAMDMLGDALHQEIAASFKPKVSEGLKNAYNFMLIRLCQGLATVGQFDMACLNGIDENRSEAVLNNIPLVSQKEPMLCQALQLRPYSVKALIRAYEEGFLLQPYCRELMDFFDLTDMMIHIVESYGVHTAERMSQAYADNKKVIFTLSGLKNIAIKDAAREVLMCDFQRLLAIYAGAGGCIKNQVPLADFLSKQYPDADVADYWAYLSSDLAIESSRFTPDEISFCASECNIGVWESLAQWYGKDFHSFNEIFNLVRSTWEQQTATALVNEREQKIEALEKELAQLKPKPAKPDTGTTIFLVILCGMLFVLPPIVGIWGFITFGDEDVLLNLFLLCFPLIVYIAIKLQPENPKQLRIEQIEQELSQLKSNEQ